MQQALEALLILQHHIVGRAMLYGGAEAAHLSRPLHLPPPRMLTAKSQATHHARTSVLLPNKLSTKSTTSSAVWLRMSSAGFSSTMSSEASRPVSAIISMHN